MDPLFEIELDLATEGSRDAASALYGRLRAAIADGRLVAGARLPATRKAQAFFGVSRNVAMQAYEMLLTAGYAVSRHGAGTYVAAVAPAAPSPPRRDDDAMPADPAGRLNPFWTHPAISAAMGFWEERDGQAQASPTKGPAIDFRPALVDSRLFPFDVFRRVSAKQLRGLERKPARLRSAQGNQGHFHLREAISRHIGMTRAVVCGADDVLVTSGAQQAFDLLARTLVTPGRTTVAIEDPGYPPMRVAFAAAGATLVPVRVDDEGLVVDELPEDASVICVCPSHQFPLGVAMSARRRKALVEFARRRGAVIVEDDYDGEFRYDGSPLEALRAADAADVVFFVGTFSKCMLASLRLGFVVAPAWALPTLVAAKNCLDWHCAVPVQMSVAGFIAEGHLAHHVRRMREVYRQRRQLLLDTLAAQLGDWLEPLPSFYGMHVAAVARADVDLDDIAARMPGRGVQLHSLARYHLGPPARAGLVFGYGAADLDDIRRGLALLRAALQR